MRRGRRSPSKFKGKRSVLSVRIRSGAFGLPDQDRRHVRLPRIGLVRTHESTRKLARRVDAGTARIRSVTVSYRRGRWRAAFFSRPTAPTGCPARPADTVGVDVGDQAPGGAVLRPGHPEPTAAGQAQRDLRRLARQASRRAGPDRRPGGNRRGGGGETQAKLRPAARPRREPAGQRPPPAGRAARQPPTAPSWSRTSTSRLNGPQPASVPPYLRRGVRGELRRQLTYKTQLATADALRSLTFSGCPSSKTCSRCGAVKAKLPLGVRVFECDALRIRPGPGRERRPQPGRPRRRRVLPELRGDGKRARWKPA